MKKGIFYGLICLVLLGESADGQEIKKPVSYYKAVVSQNAAIEKVKLAEAAVRNALADVDFSAEDVVIARKLYAKGFLEQVQLDASYLSHYLTEQKLLILQNQRQYKIQKLAIARLDMENAKIGGVSLERIRLAYLKAEKAECEIWFHKYASSKKSLFAQRAWLNWAEDYFPRNGLSRRQVDAGIIKTEAHERNTLAHYQSVQICLNKNIVADNFEPDFFAENP